MNFLNITKNYNLKPATFAQRSTYFSSLRQGEKGRKKIKDSWDKTAALHQTKFSSTAPVPRGTEYSTPESGCKDETLIFRKAIHRF